VETEGHLLTPTGKPHSVATSEPPRLTAKNVVEVREQLGGEPSSYSLPASAIADDKDSLLIIGFDTEYQPLLDVINAEDVKEGRAGVEVLSYQFYAINHLGQEWSGLVVPESDKRMALTDFVVYALAKGAEAGAALPRNIVLVGHFNKADLPVFEDREQIFYHLKNIRNSLVSLGRPVPIAVSYGDQPEQKLSVHVRDTMQLAPAGSKSLVKLGELIELPKLNLADNAQDELDLKKRMKIVRAGDWDLFREYAIRDAEVCAKYFLRVTRQYQQVTGKKGIPMALSSIGMTLLLEGWRSRGIDRDEVLGRELVEEVIYSEKHNQFLSRTFRPYLEDIALFEQFATECYHGGRNEQMWFGPSFVDDWTDYDLASAYPTAMAMIGTPDWRKARYSTELGDFSSNGMGFALAHFKFPAGVRYPTMPVRSQNGIIFPMEGKSYCCSPEIQLALALGCTITIQHGLVIPSDQSNRPFQHFIKASIAKRQDATSAIEKSFWKEATNSCYGKTAQGLREKRTFNLKDKKSERSRQSEITNPFYAALITSLVRAVIGELMNAIPTDRMVFSVTTDGFITNANEEEIKQAQQGLLCRKFSAARKILTGDPSACEQKHAMKQVLGWRTRGQATLQKNGDKEFVLARAGIRPPISHENTSEQNDYILNTFFGRTPATFIEFQVPTSFREMVLYDVDMVMKNSPRRISMEYDLKRKPYAAKETEVTIRSFISPKEQQVCRHVAFSTVPWKTISEFNAARKCRDDFWRKSPRCMKTAADFIAIAEHLDSLQALGTKKAKYMKRDNAPIARLRRDLCRAFKHGQAGLDAYQNLSAQEFADTLNKAGMNDFGTVVKRADVENGRKTPFAPNTTPATARVIAVLNALEQVFPLLDRAVLLAAPAQDGVQLLPALGRADPFIGRLQ
jgi:hypothetical protein